MRYWIKYSNEGDQIGLYRFGDNEGQFVNGRRKWQTDNCILAQVDGIGGDVSWEVATREEAGPVTANHTPYPTPRTHEERPLPPPPFEHARMCRAPGYFPHGQAPPSEA